MRRFDEHSIAMAEREGWTSVCVRTARPTGPRHVWDDHALLCVDLDNVVQRVCALSSIASLERVEFGLFDLPHAELTDCLQALSTVPQVALTLLGVDQLRALPALTDAVELQLMLGRSDKEQWFSALQELLPSFAGLPGLHRLALLGGAVDARWLPALPGLRALELVSAELLHAPSLCDLQLDRFAGWGVNDPQVVLEALGAMGSLTELSLSRCQLDDASLPLVARLRGLQVLQVPRNQIEGAGLHALADLRLHTLDLSDNAVDIRHLPPLPSLRTLDLNSVDLHGQNCGVFGSMELLEDLNLERCRVGQDVASLIGRMSNLHTLQLRACKLLDASFVSGLHRLRKLDLNDNKDLAGLGAADVRALTELREVNLRFNWRIGVSLLSALSELSHLTELNLTVCHLLPDHLRALAESSSLQRLHMAGNDVGCLGLRALAPLALSYLSVGRCEVHDRGAATLASEFPNLRYLDVHGNRLTDVGAASVMELPRLLWLDVDSNYIRRSGLTLAGAHLSNDAQNDGTPPPTVPEPCFFAEVDEQLEQAFDGVPLPQPPSPTLYQAQAADFYETCDRSRDHLGRWQDMPAEQFGECRSALSFVDAYGIRYYLPAMIRAELHSRLEPTGRYDNRYDSLSFHVTPDRTDSLREFTRERFALLDVHQRAAIASWVFAMEDDVELRSGWRRVMRHDASDDPGDWFDAFWPLEEANPVSPSR